MRHFISTQDWTVGELQALLDEAAGLRSDPVRPLLMPTAAAMRTETLTSADEAIE
jgi:ornithine carbamoyltransferase